MTIINEWVHSEWTGHFKHRKELHHIYKLDEGTLRREYHHLGWCFNQFDLNHLNNQTMTFKHYRHPRESYNFFRLTDTKMVLVHRTHSGNEYIKIIKFHKSGSTVRMETLRTHRIDRMNRIEVFELRNYIKKHGTPESPLKKYKNKDFNFASSRHRTFKKLKGDKRKTKV